MSLFGPPSIDKLTIKRNVKELVKALGYKRYVDGHKINVDFGKNADVRKAAAEALATLGDAQAVEPLIKNSHGNKYAIEALGKFGDSRAVEVLIGCKESPIKGALSKE